MVAPIERAPPADPVPAGQRDARHPARLLPYRGRDGRWEVGADRNELAICADTREHAASAERGDQQAEFVILDDRARVERQTVARGRDPTEHLAFDRAADPGERKPDPKRLAHHHLPAVCVGEFVGIVPRDERRTAIDQRQHRELDNGIAPDQRIENAQFAGVDQILGVMQHDRGDGYAVTRFVALERAPNGVEAIGFGGRSGAAVDDQPYARITRRDRCDRVDRRAVVWVGPDIQAVILMLEPRERAAQHRTDHRRLVPRRNEHRDPARRRLPIRIERPRQSGAAASQRDPDPADIDRQIVTAADEETDRREHDRFARDRIDREHDPSCPQDRLPPTTLAFQPPLPSRSS